MGVGEFIARARAAAVATADVELAALGRSSADCPYIDKYVDYYRGRSPEQVEAAIQRYVGGRHQSAESLLGAFGARARVAVVDWVRSGQVEAFPPGVPSPVQTGPDTADVVLAKGGPAPGVDPRWVNMSLRGGTPLDGGLRARMERAYGTDLSAVRVHDDAHARGMAQRFGLRAFTAGDDIAVADTAAAPGSLGGDILLAHELAHVVQQRRPGSTSSEGMLEGEADQAAVTAMGVGWGQELPGAAGAALSGTGGLRLSGCSDCNSSSDKQSGTTSSTTSSSQSAPQSTGRVPFTTVSTQVQAASDAAARDAALQAGVRSARQWADELRTQTGQGQGPVGAIRQRIADETGVGRSGGTYAHIDANPLYGVSNDAIERAFRAWAQNPASSEPPWVLLAIWVKEGLTAGAVPNTISGSSEQDARAIWRSRYYYQNMGADHYVHYTATAGDNTISTVPGAGADHDTAFVAAITAQVNAGRLPRNIASEIDAAITVTPVTGSAGSYTISASDDFYSLSLMLVDAYWRENRDALSGNPDVAAMSPSDEDLRGLTYMRWNMGATSMGQFLGRSMAGNADPDGTIPSLPVWAFHREVRSDEWGQPRANAIRFMYAVEVYRLVYEGFP